MTHPPHPSLPPLPPRAEEPAGVVWGSFRNAAGAQMRFAFSPPPAGTAVKGHIVMLPGFRETIEKYFEAMRDLHARGYAVWMMDWRGQGGSQRYLPDHPHRAHHAGYIEQIAALEQFISQHVQAGKPADLPLHLIGHSMGGHLALRYLHDHNAPDAAGRRPVTSAMLTAPMLDIQTGTVPRAVVRQMARLAKVTGTMDKYVPNGAGWNLSAQPAQQGQPAIKASLDLDPATSNLSSDPARIAVLATWFTRNPALALGDPTYGWIYHTLASIDILNDESYLRAIDTPVLMQISGDERVVVRAASERAAGLLPACTRLDIPEARHEIWMERDDLRRRWLAAVDAFLTTGPGAAPTVKKPRAQRKPRPHR